MTDQISFLPMLDDADHPTWLLSGKPGMQNENGVYVENVFRFREGKLTGVNVEVELCAEGNFVLFELSPMQRMPPCQQCGISRGDDFLHVQKLRRAVRQELDELSKGNKETFGTLQEGVRTHSQGGVICNTTITPRSTATRER